MTTTTVTAGRECTTLKGVFTPKDFEALCNFEQQHKPVIRTPEKIERGEVFELLVEVGNPSLHPNAAGHFIEWIEAYAGNTFLFRVNLSSALSQPRVSIPVRLGGSGTLRVWHKCNLHGIWEGTKEIAVEG